MYFIFKFILFQELHYLNWSVLDFLFLLKYYEMYYN